MSYYFRENGLHEQGLKYRAVQQEAGLEHLRMLCQYGFVKRDAVKGRIKYTIMKPLPKVTLGIHGELGIYRMRALLHTVHNSWITTEQWDHEVEELYKNLVDAFKE